MQTVSSRKAMMMDRGMQAMTHLPNHWIRVNRALAGGEEELRSQERRIRRRRR
jgi:hypothetical protein